MLSNFARKYVVRQWSSSVFVTREFRKQMRGFDLEGHVRGVVRQQAGVVFGTHVAVSVLSEDRNGTQRVRISGKGVEVSEGESDPPRYLIDQTPLEQTFHVLTREGAQAYLES